MSKDSSSNKKPDIIMLTIELSYLDKLSIYIYLGKIFHLKRKQICTK